MERISWHKLSEARRDEVVACASADGMETKSVPVDFQPRFMQLHRNEIKTRGAGGGELR